MHVRFGRKSIGWHVLVLPHMDQRPLYAEIAPDADGGARDHAEGTVTPAYFCPTAEPPSTSSAPTAARSIAPVDSEPEPPR